MTLYQLLHSAAYKTTVCKPSIVVFYTDDADAAFHAAIVLCKQTHTYNVTCTAGIWKFTAVPKVFH